MRVSATAKYQRASTRKTRLVTEAIKGRPVEEAAALLRFMPQKAATDVARVLKSATANAENNHNLAAEDLDRKSTRLNSSHVEKSYAVFCLKKNSQHDIFDNHAAQMMPLFKESPADVIHLEFTSKNFDELEAFRYFSSDKVLGVAVLVAKNL